MQLLKLNLVNIRSYRQKTIDFPQGSVLLAGDIGSGKSTILLAIEFALFGLIRGQTGGSTLLRNGATKGEVTLTCVIHNKTVTINRTLVRNKKTIVQQDTNISIDGIAQQYTPTQATAQIRELLGYPSTTNTNLLYRYTVFTSQEQMKAIITESAEIRLNTLRALFGIDKYKHITTNATHYIRELKSSAKVQQALGQGLAALQKEQEEHKQRLEELETKKRETQKVKEEQEKLLEILQTKVTAQQQELNTIIQQQQLFKQKTKQTDNIEHELHKLRTSITESEQEEVALQKEIHTDMQKIDDATISTLQNKITDQKKSLENLQQEVSDLTNKKFEYTTLQKQCKEQLTELEELDAQKITTQLKSTAEKLESIEELKKESVQKREMHNTLQVQLATLNEHIKNNEQLDIDHLKICPTCKQEISEEHKLLVKKEAEEKKAIHEKKIRAIEHTLASKTTELETIHRTIEQESESKIQLRTLQDQLQKLNKKEEITITLRALHQKLEIVTIQEEKLNKHKQNNSTLLKEEEEKLAKLYLQQKNWLEQQNKKQRIASLQQQREKTQQDVVEKQKELAILQEEIKKQPALQKQKEAHEQKLHTLQKEYDTCNQQLKITFGLFEATQTNITNIQTHIEKNKKTITEKQHHQQQAQKIENTHIWIKDFFIPLMETIEQHVLLSIYHECNQLFMNWFSLLMEDESMQASLDTTFTPIVQQNGYDIDIQYLSGGERTSLALAYRLALNKVVNEMIEHIQTKDILILDEPTEGFSSQQLDRVKVVLDQIKSKQLIVVSHEQKMESFVDHVIRVSKENGVSG